MSARRDPPAEPPRTSAPCAVGGSWRRQALGVGVVLILGACRTVHGDCEDDPRAEAPGERIELMLADEILEAEVATTAQARDRPWAFRRCDLEALAIVWDTPGAHPLALCDVQTEVDIAFVQGDTVVEAVKFAPPCVQPCEQCPLYGAAQTQVDAVVVMLPGLVSFFNGQQVLGLDRAAP